MKKLLSTTIIALTLLSFTVVAVEEDGANGQKNTTNSTPVVTCYQVKTGSDGSNGLKTVCVVQTKSDQEGSGGNQ